MFYYNLRREGNSLKSRVKGVDIATDNAVLENVAGLRSELLSSHHRIAGYESQGLYNTMLRKPVLSKYSDDFNIRNLQMDECVCAYVITWILLPSEDDHSLLTDEDIYLIYALSSGIQIN